MTSSVPLLIAVQFQIPQDRSFGEYLEYAFTAANAMLLLVLWRRTAATAYLANGVLFLWHTADNAFEIHEGFGHRIVDLFPVHPGGQVAANDIGEVMRSVCCGAACARRQCVR